MVTFTRICSPCQIRYEFIGLMCSFEEDMTEILKSVGADKIVSLPQRNQTGYEHNETNVILQDHVKEVTKNS